MSEELEALESIRGCLQTPYLEDIKNILTPYLDIIETALKELEAKREIIGDIFTGDDEKKLKALEIIKSFNDYQIVEVQGQWYLMRGIEFGKSIKMPITKEQADLLKEIL